MPDLSSRLAAALAERYRMERKIGEGGMATVFLAEDLKHHRKVALKVLRPELAAVVGAERFLAEIRTTAKLQHPHILPLYDSGEADSFLFFAMPYVDGEALRDRLEKEKQLPIADALRIAKGVASALDYAHRRGVVHRDIKPENILLHEGQPLVADFGIAVALSTAGGSRVTETGLSLGTPTYMSPEQAMGEGRIDPRSDIYSLGCVVYEMLTGDPPFTGSTAQAVAARVLTEAPRPLSTQRHTIPAQVEAAVLVALEKLPADRFPTAQAFAEALDGRGTPMPHAMRGASRVWRGTAWETTFRDPVVWLLALIAILAVAVAYRGWINAPGAPSDATVRFTVALPPGFQPALYEPHGPAVAISPDGSMVAFPVVDPRGRRRIFVRRLDEATARPLPGTDAGTMPAFSADGAFLLFQAAGRLQKVALDGGTPEILGEYGFVQSATWSPGGDIIYAAAELQPLMRLPSSGGEPRPAAALDSVRGETAQYFPVALPDGRHVLYQSRGRGASEDARIGLLDLVTGQARRLNVPGTFPLGMLAARLIYTDQAGTVFAVPLDLASGNVKGEPVQVASGVATLDRGSAVAALSATGTLAYMAGNQGATVVLANAERSEPLFSEVRPYSFPRFSPDGRRVALTITSGTSSDIWLGDVGSGTLKRLTSGGTVNERPEWSPDGTRVLFRRVVGARSALWWQRADGTGAASPVIADARADYFEGVITPDGRELVYQVDTTGGDVMVRGLDDDLAPRPIANGRANEDQARVSPDGRWVVYVTEESGGPQVVVQPLSGPEARVQVSTRGGTEPVWARDGRRLFYRTEGEFRVAEVSATPTFHVVSRADFMDDTFLPFPNPHANYDVAPDGTELLVLKGEQQALLVVHDWKAKVEARLRQGEKR